MEMKFFLYFLFLVLSVHSFQSGKRKEVPCSKPYLKNGKVKLKAASRIAKFSCDKGFYLLGESFSTCIKGQWSSPTPVCASKNCAKPKPPDNGQIVFTVLGAKMFVECYPGYIISGTRTLYCDGEQWNGTIPTCIAGGTKPSVSCDFEKESICGWTQDPRDDFDWLRINSATPSGHVGTGPSHDKTKGEGQLGYFMYIEASAPRLENDTARLISPVYGSDLTRDGCFIFHYHMYGATTGRLHVYVKPESAKLSEVKPIFTKIGDQGNHWRQGYFPLPVLEENFQIVIEGVRGPSYVSDTAIDDVMLAQGEPCRTAASQNNNILENEDITKKPSTVPPDSSCHSFCGTAKSGSRTCDCHAACKIEGTCCADLTDFCFEGSPSTTASSATLKSTTRATAEPDREDGDNNEDNEYDPGSSATTVKATSTSSTDTTTSTIATNPTTTSLATTTTTVPTATTATTTITTDSATTSTTTAATTKADSTTTVAIPSITTMSSTTTTIPYTTTASTPATTTGTATTPSTTTTTAATTTTATTTTTLATPTTTSKPSTTTTILTTTPTTTTTTTTTTRKPTTTATTTTTTAATRAATTTTTSKPTTTTLSTAKSATTTATSPATTSTTTSPMATISFRPDPEPGHTHQEPSSDANMADELKKTDQVTLGVTLGCLGFVALVVLVTGAVLRWKTRKPKLPKAQDHLPEDSDVRYLNVVDDAQLETASVDESKFINIEQV